MTNLLQNPTLGNWEHERYFFDQEGRTGTIERPQNWEFVVTPKMEDQNRIPQSLHRDRGFVITASGISWEAGYVQRGVQLQANQRYLAKAVYKPDVNFLLEQGVDLTAVTWRFLITSNGEDASQGWQATGKGQYKQEEENLYVFQTASAVTIDYGFIGRSVYGGNSCDLVIYELALEPVGPDYGGPDVPVIGTVAAAPAPAETASTPAPVGVVTEAAAPSTETVAEPATPTVTADVTGPNGKTLGEVLSNEDIDQIAEGLRALASESGVSAAMGLRKLAEGLERLKSS